MKLSRVQQVVLNALANNRGSYIRESVYYNHNDVISPTGVPSKWDETIMTHQILSFSKPTLEVLKRLELIVYIKDYKYELTTKGWLLAKV